MTVFYTVVIWSFPIIVTIIIYYIVALTQHIDTDIFRIKLSNFCTDFIPSDTGVSLNNRMDENAIE